MGRLEEVRATLEECVKASKRVQGPEHPHTLRATDNLALTALKQGFAAEAAATFAALLELTPWSAWGTTTTPSECGSAWLWRGPPNLRARMTKTCLF